MSYHYYRQRDLLGELAWYGQPTPDVLADSGAFSAWSLGATIDVRAYAAWCRAHAHVVTAYANLDVIGDPEATKRNQEIMESLGTAPLPIFHFGEPWSYLERYLDRYPYIMLGGIVSAKDRPRRTAMGWLVQCFKRALSSGTQFHGLGVSSHAMLRTLPFFSADASSWLQARKWGHLRLWDDRMAQWVSVNPGTPGRIFAAGRLLRSYGIEPEVIRHKKPDRRLTDLLAVGSWMRYEQWLRHHHGLLTLPEQPAVEPGHKYYLAGAEVMYGFLTSEHMMVTGRAGLDGEPGEALPPMPVRPVASRRALRRVW